MSNNYAQWDQGPFQQPPQPPRRPDFWEWRAMSETRKAEYEASVSAYLLALRDDRWWTMLCDMSCFYQSHEAEGNQDANWKRGGPR